MNQHSASSGAGVSTAPPPTGEAKSTKSKNRRIAAASLVGTLIEGYDFVIYGTAAALVFPTVFFPALGGAAGTVASLATLGVAFVARPFGSVLFGHFGDRLGRKKTLVTTLLIMGIATVLIGLVPTAGQIGIAAPICIVVLRAVQGLAVGGEWAGSTLFVAEHAPKSKRGRWAVFPQLGHALPTAMASATFLIIGAGMSNETFLNWGWRIPFIGSAVLVALGLWVRLKIEETPVFTQAKEQDDLPKQIPFVDAFKNQPRAILTGAGLALMSLSFLYVCNSYLANFATTQLGFSRNFVLTVSFVAGLLFATGVVCSAVFSDRVGRRPMIGGANLAAVLWAPVIFPIIAFGGHAGYAIAIIVTLSIAGLAYGAVGAFLPEQFHTRYRYTAAGLSYNLTGVFGGGIAPLVAPVIVSSTSTYMFGFVMAGIALVATVCTFSLKETNNADISS